MLQVLLAGKVIVIYCEVNCFNRVFDGIFNGTSDIFRSCPTWETPRRRAG